MGLMFTPLSTLTLANVPRHKMTKASGLYNVIRQIGGSFGVALIGSLLIRRNIFHSTIHGDAMCEYSPAFKNTKYQFGYFARHAVGGTMCPYDARSKALIIDHVMQQALVSAVNDDFLVSAAITVACLIPIFFMR
jgi:DHA2 family multidrug resistance protein